MSVQLKPPRERRMEHALEALFREARMLERRRRRRHALIVGFALVAVAAVAYTVVQVSSGPASKRGGQPSSGVASVGVSVAPKDPSTLAVGPNGVLYIADPGRQEILKRLPGGRFEVAVGTDVAGDSGDGGPATRAEVDRPSSMAIARNGALYFAQQGRGFYDAGDASGPPTVVREVAPSGRITTVVGAHPACRVAGATARSIPAQDAFISDPALAIGPNGNLYLSTNLCPNALRGGPLLELTRSGSLIAAPLNNRIAAGCGYSGLAFSASGAVYIACDSGAGHRKELLIVGPNGTTKAFPGIYPYDDSSGFTTAPDGTVIAIDYLKVVSVTPQGARTIIDLGYDAHHKFLGTVRGISGSMEPNGIAVDRHANIYLASTSAFGNGTFTGIIEIHAGGRVQVLWSRPSSSG